MTKNYLRDPAFADIASLLAASEPPTNFLSRIQPNDLASAFQPPRNELAEALRAMEMSGSGRAAPPTNALSDLARAFNPLQIDAIFQMPWETPAPPVPASLKVEWARPVNDWWFLEVAARYAPSIGGVYIIWRDGDRRCVKVGQGKILDRLGAHWRDRAILSAAKGASLRATWCPVHVHLRDSVERFLGDHYAPLVAERFPDAQPIRVNLPG